MSRTDNVRRFIASRRTRAKDYRHQSDLIKGARLRDDRKATQIRLLSSDEPGEPCGNDSAPHAGEPGPDCCGPACCSTCCPCDPCCVHTGRSVGPDEEE